MEDWVDFDAIWNWYCGSVAETQKHLLFTNLASSLNLEIKKVKYIVDGR